MWCPTTRRGSVGRLRISPTTSTPGPVPPPKPMLAAERKRSRRSGVTLPRGGRLSRRRLRAPHHLAAIPADHHGRIRHSNFIKSTFGETRRRVKVIGRLPGERSCLSLVWAVLDRASRAWRGVKQTHLLDPPAQRAPSRPARPGPHRPRPPSPRRCHTCRLTSPSGACASRPFAPDLGRHRAQRVAQQVSAPPGMLREAF